MKFDDYEDVERDNSTLKYELYKLVEHDAINEVEFEGFPDLFMSHDIELFNYRYTMCCIADFMGRPTVCRMSLLPNFKNIYGMPTKCMVTYPDMTTGESDIYSDITPEGVIPFYDTMVPGDGRITRVWYWITQYYETQLTINTQLTTHRTPIIMAGTNKNVIEGQAKLVTDIGAGTKVLAMPQNVVSQLQVMDLKAPWDGPDLIQMQAEFMRRIYACLGLDSPSWQKKERLIVDEQEANNDSLSRVLQDMLKIRSLSCMLANAKYGWNVTVNITESPRFKDVSENKYNNVERPNPYNWR